MLLHLRRNSERAIARCGVARIRISRSSSSFSLSSASTVCLATILALRAESRQELPKSTPEKVAALFVGCFLVIFLGGRLQIVVSFHE